MQDSRKKTSSIETNKGKQLMRVESYGGVNFER